MSRNSRARFATKPERGPQRQPTGEQKMLGQALTLMRAGQLAQASDLCDAVLLLNPQQPDALHMGGVIALQQGRLEKAIERLARLAGLQPKNTIALSDLGYAFQLAGRLVDAERVLSAALAERPDFTQAWNNLGNVLGALGKDDDALVCYRRAIALQPDFPEAHSNLALLALKLGLRLEAVDEARQALQLRPGMPGAMQGLGLALASLGRFEEALDVQQKAVAMHPRSAEPRADLAHTLAYSGRLDEAAGSFRAAIQMRPSHGEWHRELASIVKHKTGDADVAEMERIYKSPGVAVEDRMHLAFGLGKALDDFGAYGEAFDYFLEANRLRRQTFNYDSRESDRTFAELETAFTPDFLSLPARLKPSFPTPIFVVGMPRSGTSLVEQILATHPDVAGAGELPLLNRLTGGLKTTPGPFSLPSILPRLNEATIDQMASAYLDYMHALEPNGRFVVDKMPGNFMLIPIIRLLFPDAKVIHCKRDAVDNSLSIFKIFFSSTGLRYAYDLAEIGNYHRLYLRLMRHWHAIMPGFIHDLSYEALVDDLEGEGRKLFDFAGLDWQPAALEFHKSRRRVQTASVFQVRQPLYRSSIGQAERYGDRLKPLLDALGSAAVA